MDSVSGINQPDKQLTVWRRRINSNPANPHYPQFSAHFFKIHLKGKVLLAYAVYINIPVSEIR
jgi:hypothetical protein